MSIWEKQAEHWIALATDAADLPFENESFDLVVSYNSLMDIDDMPGAVREAWRVLRPGRAPLYLRHAPGQRRGAIRARRAGSSVSDRRVSRSAAVRRDLMLRAVKPA